MPDGVIRDRREKPPGRAALIGFVAVFLLFSANVMSGKLSVERWGAVLELPGWAELLLLLSAVVCLVIAAVQREKAAGDTLKKH
jgi:hypothetical protein